MSELARMWMEISFDVLYLIVIWALVILMANRKDWVSEEDKKAANLFWWAFVLLALGDTGHVGFRVLAYMMGDISSTISILGRQVSLVGAGAVSTAYTVTLFYILMLYVWLAGMKKKHNWFTLLLLVLSVTRMIFMAFPINQWNSVVPPQPWSTIRNIPLTIVGLSVAYLFLFDSNGPQKGPYKWMGISILVSYACYIPVILFVQKVPIIGMLMIPKTMAYVAVAIIGYQYYYLSENKHTKPVI